MRRLRGTKRLRPLYLMWIMPPEEVDNLLSLRRMPLWYSPLFHGQGFCFRNRVLVFAKFALGDIFMSCTIFMEAARKGIGDPQDLLAYLQEGWFRCELFKV